MKMNALNCGGQTEVFYYNEGQRAGWIDRACKTRAYLRAILFQP